MRALLFGPSGQLGREIVDRAARHGVTLLPVDRAMADLTDAGAVAAVVEQVDVDIVINAAAYTAVDQAEAEEEIAHAVNAAAPGAMARACAARGLPLIHVSTDYVFDGSGTTPWREADPVGPIGAYGRSKLAGERAVAEAGGQTLIVRTSWVFSPHGRNFVKTVLSLAGRPELRVVDDQYGRPTAAGDLAEALLVAARRMVEEPDGPVRGLLHFAGDGATTWRRFAEAVFKAAGGPAPVITPVTTREYPTLTARPANSVLDCGRVETLLGIRPRAWRDGLAETVRALADRAGEPEA
ncbi:MAG: dTDP-4-dehydrorhamnose reductase [Caulobacter sp.]|nr:dTDP-4-dehydrorhamnose reductase [Caulobacter sp.]